MYFYSVAILDTCIIQIPICKVGRFWGSVNTAQAELLIQKVLAALHLNNQLFHVYHGLILMDEGKDMLAVIGCSASHDMGCMLLLSKSSTQFISGLSSRTLKNRRSGTCVRHSSFALAFERACLSSTLKTVNLSVQKSSMCAAPEDSS